MAASDPHIKKKVPDPLDPRAKPKVPILSTSHIDVGFSNQTIISDYFINTTTTVTYLSLGFTKLFQLKSLSEYTWAGGVLKYGAPVTEIEQKIAPYQKIGGVIYTRFLMDELIAGAHLDYESLNFVNLPVTGQGLQASENNLVWLKFSIDYASELLERKSTFSAYLGIPLYTQSDYNNLDSSGFTGFEYGVSFQMDNVYRMIGLRLNLGMINIESGLKEVSYAGDRLIDKLKIQSDFIELQGIIDF